MKPKVFTSILLTASICGILVLSLRNSKAEVTTTAPNERRSQLVNTARLINTTEASYKAQQGKYAGWDEVSSSQRFRGSGGLPAGVNLKLTTDGGGAYQFRLTDESDSCRQSAFSDEKAIIYLGTEIDCAPR